MSQGVPILSPTTRSPFPPSSLYQHPLQGGGSSGPLRIWPSHPHFATSQFFSSMYALDPFGSQLPLLLADPAYQKVYLSLCLFLRVAYVVSPERASHSVFW